MLLQLADQAGVDQVAGLLHKTAFQGDAVAHDILNLLSADRCYLIAAFGVVAQDFLAA